MPISLVEALCFTMSSKMLLWSASSLVEEGVVASLAVAVPPDLSPECVELDVAKVAEGVAWFAARETSKAFSLRAPLVADVDVATLASGLARSVMGGSSSSRTLR